MPGKLLTVQKQKVTLIFSCLLLLLMYMPGPAIPHVQAGAWTLPRGEFWTKVSWYNLNTDKQFAEIPGILPEVGAFGHGDKVPFPNDGRSLSRAVFLDIMYGVSDRWDVGIKVPFYIQEFQDNVSRSRGQNTRRTGFSDLLGMIKYRIMLRPIVLSVTTEVKFPTGEFVNIDGVVPVGEGQMDFAGILSLGTSFWPLPGYTNLDLGWRIRTKNTAANFDPGDEFYFLWEGGYNVLPRLPVTVKVFSMTGRRSKFGLAIAQQTRKREILYISPEVGFRIQGNWYIGGGVNIPVKGRSYPAGHQYFLSFSTKIQTASQNRKN